MLTSRLRNGKMRVVSSVVVCAGFIITIFILRDVHIKLNDARDRAERCHQKHESLAAQLQVMSEHKSRLDKSLQMEIHQHKKTREDLHVQYQQMHDKEKQEASNRLKSQKQQYEMLQTQLEDLQEELQKFQKANSNLMQEKQQLNNKLAEQLQAQKQSEKQLDELKITNLDCKKQFDDVNREMLDVKFKLGRTNEQLLNCKGDSKTKPNETSTANEVKVLIDKRNINQLNNKNSEIDVNNAEKFVKTKKNEIIDKDDIKKFHDDSDPVKNEVVDFKPKIEAMQQLAPPNHPIINNNNQLNLNHKPDEDDEAKQEEFRGNGLEQQENGDDQDLDNMEDDDEGEGAAHKKEEGKVFEDADFDQIEDGIKPLPLRAAAAAPFDNDFH